MCIYLCRCKTCAQMEKHKTYLNKIKSDASRHKEYRQKAVERMKKRRAELSILPKKNKATAAG